MSSYFFDPKDSQTWEAFEDDYNSLSPMQKFVIDTIESRIGEIVLKTPLNVLKTAQDELVIARQVYADIGEMGMGLSSKSFREVFAKASAEYSELDNKVNKLAHDIQQFNVDTVKFATSLNQTLVDMDSGNKYEKVVAAPVPRLTVTPTTGARDASERQMKDTKEKYNVIVQIQKALTDSDPDICYKAINEAYMSDVFDNVVQIAIKQLSKRILDASSSNPYVSIIGAVDAYIQSVTYTRRKWVDPQHILKMLNLFLTDKFLDALRELDVIVAITKPEVEIPDAYRDAIYDKVVTIPLSPIATSKPKASERNAIISQLQKDIINASKSASVSDKYDRYRMILDFHKRVVDFDFGSTVSVQDAKKLEANMLNDLYPSIKGTKKANRHRNLESSLDAFVSSF